MTATPETRSPLDDRALDVAMDAMFGAFDPKWNYDAWVDPKRSKAREKVAVGIAAYLAAAPAAPAPEPDGWQWRWRGTHPVDIPGINGGNGGWSGWRPGRCEWTGPGLEGVEVQERSLFAAPPAPVAASEVDGIRQALIEARGWVELAEDFGRDNSKALAMIDAALAATPSSPNPVAGNPAGDPVVNAPRVRELVWEPYPNPVFAGPDVGVAKVDGVVPCFYQVQRNPRGPGFIAFAFPGHGSETWHSDGHSTLEAAKAAAQSDYERRVLACLEPGQEISPDFTDTARSALLWVLWHHQGGSSKVGQPIRYALGMGQHDPLSSHQVKEARRWGAQFEPSTPPPPAAEGQS